MDALLLNSRAPCVRGLLGSNRWPILEKVNPCSITQPLWVSLIPKVEIIIARCEIAIRPLVLGQLLSIAASTLPIALSASSSAIHISSWAMFIMSVDPYASLHRAIHLLEIP